VSEPVDVFGHLFLLARRARQAAHVAELGFILVNETRLLAPYRQAALWSARRGLIALSGVVAPESNAPYAQWLERVFAGVVGAERRPTSADFAGALPAAEPTVTVTPQLLTSASLPAELAAEWAEWLPPYALWLPLNATAGAGGVLLAREEPWHEEEIALLAEWVDLWSESWSARHRPTTREVLLQAAQTMLSWLPRRADWQTLVEKNGWRNAWSNRRLRGVGLIALVLLFPVRLSVLAPGELVPAHPAVIRAPLDGIIDRIIVTPNQPVKAGDPLFEFDRVTLANRLQVAEQNFATAEAEYRQAAQQALFDPKSKTQLTLVQGKLAEKKAEVEYLQSLNQRAVVTAPRDGVVMFNDVTEWVGRPVATGERVMIVADEHDSEVEAWLSPADMIDLNVGADVSLYLNSSPFSPVNAAMRYVAHTAQERPDGSFAYRLRARITEDSNHLRVGLKGSAKIAGQRVPLLYWILRKPLAALRIVIGW
jgi:biotin carboxyl carrier protein